MINLHFHWAWLLIAAIIIVGICIAYPALRNTNDTLGLSGVVGCAVIVIAALLALVIGGIFIW